MNDYDLLLLRGQLSLARVTLFGFLFMLMTLIAMLSLPSLKTEPEMIALVSTAVGVLGTIATQQNQHFFKGQTSTGDKPVDPTKPAPPAP